MEKLSFKDKTLIFYLTIEIFLYLSFLSIDIFFNEFNEVSSLLKYFSIILNLIYLIFITIISYTKERLILVLAFIFTLISDYFLLFKTDYNSFLIGLIFFNIVQLIYFFKYQYLNFNKMKFLISMILRIIFIVIGILIIYFLLPTLFSLLNISAYIYFINLFFNFLDPLINNIKIKKNIILSLGFLLFIFCDINVGIVNLFNANIIFSILMWFFYLPSQILLFYSVYMDDKHIENNQ